MNLLEEILKTGDLKALKALPPVDQKIMEEQFGLYIRFLDTDRDKELETFSNNNPHYSKRLKLEDELIKEFESWYSSDLPKDLSSAKSFMDFLLKGHVSPVLTFRGTLAIVEHGAFTKLITKDIARKIFNGLTNEENHQ